jgi:hypothetical protein
MSSILIVSKKGSSAAFEQFFCQSQNLAFPVGLTA